tara:strand:+ start:635 stop:1240 length:606 start_codon:yes stop_codon:yes gene_type:complete
MPFGYIGQNQTKQKIKNSGVLSSFDVSHLEKQGHASGSIEHIETETFNGVSTVNFDDLGNFETHLFVMNNIHLDDNRDQNLYAKTGGSVDDGSHYSRAFVTGGSADGEDRDNSLNRFRLWAQTGNATGEAFCGWLYMYNALDSSKYTLFNQFGSQTIYNGVQEINFGGGAYKQNNTLSGIQFYPSSSTMAGSIELYGIKNL